VAPPNRFLQQNLPTLDIDGQGTPVEFAIKNDALRRAPNLRSSGIIL
jgi:hypothetical protein